MQKKLLNNGNIKQLATGRWVGVVWYRDEQGERKRRSFSGKTKTSVSKKITDYIADFNAAIEESDEAKKRQTWYCQGFFAKLYRKKSHLAFITPRIRGVMKFRAGQAVKLSDS